MTRSFLEQQLAHLSYGLYCYLIKKFAIPEKILEAIINKKDKKWIVYGAGKHTEWIQSRFGFFDDVDVAAIIDDNRKGRMFGVDICTLPDAVEIDFDCVLISSADYEAQIYEAIKLSPVLAGKQIYKLYDIRQCDDEIYRLVSPEAVEFICRINNDKSKNKILYFSSQSFFSPGRQIEHLKRMDDVSVFQVLPYAKTSGHLEHSADQHCCNGNFYDIVWILSNIDVSYVHCYFSMCTNYLFAFVHLFCKAKSIYEVVDVTSFFLSKEDLYLAFEKSVIDVEMEAEKLLFENVDVLLVQSDAAENKLRKYFNISSKIVRFIPIVDKRFVQIPNIKKSTEKIRIAYAGIVMPMSFEKRFWGDTQILNIARIMGENRLNFDIFPNDAMGYGGMYDEYLELSARCEYFRILDGVSSDKIAKTLSDYHFGSMLYLFDGVDVKSDHLSSVVPTKFITYIEAGIPVLVSKKLGAVADIVQECGIGLVVDEAVLVKEGGLRNEISGCDYALMLKNVKTFQERRMGEIDKIFFEIYNIKGGNKCQC